MTLLSEKVKLDVALTPASLNGAGTGQYFDMSNYRKALFVVTLGAMAAGVTSAIQVMQAQGVTGVGKVVANNAATVTANTKVSRAAITSALIHVAGDTVTINGLTFTAAANDGGANSRTYAIGANAATGSSANLAAKINSAVVGVPGVRATANAGVITLEADGENTITITASAGAVAVPSTLNAVAYVECDDTFLDDANGFDSVAIRVTNSAATLTGVTLIREGRYSPAQQVSAAKTDTTV